MDFPLRTQAQRWQALFTYTILIALTACTSTTIDRPHSPVDLETLLSLPELDQKPVQLQKPYMLAIYFREVDCTTCVDENLLKVYEFIKAHKPPWHLVLVAHQNNYNPTKPNPYLRNLKRVGRLKAPILIEMNPNQSGLGPNFSLNLIDTLAQTIIIRYEPEIGRDDWQHFEKVLQYTLR